MGCTTSLPDVPPENSSRLDPARHHSRSNYVWIRPGSEFEATYDVLETIGRGSVGEVTIVRKKFEGNRSLSAVAAIPVSSSSSSSSSSSRSSSKSRGKSKSSHYRTEEFASEHSISASKLERRFACKTMSTTFMSDEELKEFVDEIEILRDFDHPNVVQLFECYQDKRKVYCVMELCSGGDLTARGQLEEFTALRIAEQICRALAYIHKEGIVHHDLKLENVMFLNPEPDDTVKLIDFGLSQRFVVESRGGGRTSPRPATPPPDKEPPPASSPVSTSEVSVEVKCGTIYTAAPELFAHGGYSAASDMWSVGVILYVVICGTFPFLESEEDLLVPEKLRCLKLASYSMSAPVWNDVSFECKDFIASCLRKKEADRLTASEALKRINKQWAPCFDESGTLTTMGPYKRPNSLRNLLARGGSKNDVEARPSSVGSRSSSITSRDSATAGFEERQRLPTITLRSFENFAAHGELKKKILVTIAHTMDKGQLQELRRAFEAIDVSGQGTISYEQFNRALLAKRSANESLSDKKVKEIFEGVNLNKDGKIRYMDFVASVLESRNLITAERLLEAFDRMDEDNTGFISKKNLKQMLGVDYDEAEVDEWLRQAGVEGGNGEECNVDYEKFVKLFAGVGKGS